MTKQVQQLDDWDGTCAGLWQVIAPEGLHVRETPGGKSLTVLRQYSVVYVWCASGAWYCVQTTDQVGYVTGWSHSRWLTPLVESAGLARVWAPPAPGRMYAAYRIASRLRNN